jgi:hypothetical protein
MKSAHLYGNRKALFDGPYEILDGPVAPISHACVRLAQRASQVQIKINGQDETRWVIDARRNGWEPNRLEDEVDTCCSMNGGTWVVR